MRGPWYIVWLVIIFAILLSLVIGLLEIQVSPIIVDVRTFSTTNITIEVLRTALCLGIFGVRWLTRKFGTDLRSIFVAVTFLAVGILVLFRLLTFPYMPSGLGPSETINHSLYFGFFLRYTIGAFMLVSVFIPYDRPASLRTGWILLTILLAYSAGVIALILAPGSPLPPAFEDFGASYGIRTELESGDVLLLFLAALGYARLVAAQRERRFFFVSIGLVLIAQAGFAFVQTDSFLDLVFLVGRATALIGFLLVFYALMKTSLVRPYESLEKATRDAIAAKKDVEDKTAELRVLSQDLTERKLVEAALRESEKNYRLLVETTTEGIWRSNIDGKTTFVNRQLADMLGCTVEEMKGKEIFDFADEAGRNSAQLHIDKLKKGEREKYDLVLTRTDGAKIDVFVSVSPLIDELGEFIGSVAVLSDITERKSAERALRESERTLFNLLDELPVGVVVSDPTGRQIFSNEKSRQLLGKGVNADASPEDLAAYYQSYVTGTDTLYPNERAPIFRALKGESSMVDDVEIRRPDGKHMLEVWGAPVLDSDGRVLYGVAAFQDVTDRKASEKEISSLNRSLEEQAQYLADVNRELEAFSYSVSHDLRAPLRSIDGFSKILMEDYAGKLDEKGADYLKRVRSACQRMGQLIDDLLKLSKVTRDEMKWETVDLSKIAKAVMVDLKRLEPDRKIKLTVVEGVTLSGDAHLYRILMTNLIENAWKFTAKQPKPVIEFGVTTISGEKVYFVRDNGAGFDMAYADKLFMPFQRLHSSIEFAGTGIGLATAQRIVRRHGGRIWAEGEPGKGATFYFTEGRRGLRQESAH